MICVHLRELYSLCEEHQLRLGGSDLIRIVCKQCQKQDTCPSTLRDEQDDPELTTASPDAEEKTPGD